MITLTLQEVVNIEFANLANSMIDIYEFHCTTAKTPVNIVKQNTAKLTNYFSKNKFVDFQSLPISIQKIFSNKKISRLEGELITPRWLIEQENLDLFNSIETQQKKLNEKFEFHFEKKEYSQTCELDNNLKSYFGLQNNFVIKDKVLCLICNLDGYHFCKSDNEKITDILERLQKKYLTIAIQSI